MEILLLSDIPGIGKKNDLLVVGNGYALNYLLPDRKALVVTPSVRRRYAEKIKQRALEREREKTTQSSSLKAITGKKVTVSAPVTKTGKLYAAVSAAAIVDAVEKQLSVGIRERDLRIDSPVKTLGEHTIGIVSGTDTASFTIEVKADDSKK